MQLEHLSLCFHQHSGLEEVRIPKKDMILHRTNPCALRTHYSRALQMEATPVEILVLQEDGLDSIEKHTPVVNLSPRTLHYFNVRYTYTPVLTHSLSLHTMITLILSLRYSIIMTFSNQISMLLTRVNQLYHQAHGGHASLGTPPAIRATASASAIDYAAEASSETRAGAREAMC